MRKDGLRNQQCQADDAGLVAVTFTVLPAPGRRRRGYPRRPALKVPEMTNPHSRTIALESALRLAADMRRDHVNRATQ